MKNCYGYIRVSTVKQGERGVSLQEQRAAIERYAVRNDLQIVEWFDERLTAAKKGRPLFTKMLKKLRNGEATGVVIHKIDRSTRNLRDWAELGELIDAGVAVHFANESVDLQSRGGRLSADIQAVVAADYIRNLREEALKGIRGRLKQGIYPFGAPLGYCNEGAGKPKTIDPHRGPLVAEAFALYATGRYSLDTLATELHRRGLRNRRGTVLSRRGLADILNNPFYTGLIRIRTTNETYEGRHSPLVSTTLFKQVQAQLTQRARIVVEKHDFALRGLFHCSLCHRILTGERQKGHVYYRCHNRECPTKGFREEALEQALLGAWPALVLGQNELDKLGAILDKLQSLEAANHSDNREHLQMQIGAVTARLARLVDALVDGHLDKAAFDTRKRELLEEKQHLEAGLERPSEAPMKQMLIDTFELASSPQQSYGLGNLAARRELAIRLCSNRSVAGKKIVVEPHPVLRIIQNRNVVRGGGPYRIRTDDLLIANEALYQLS